MANKRYFFTYGTAGQPFVGGWTEIKAPSYECAVNVFKAYHPNKIEGMLNCADIYTEKAMKSTEMWKIGNFGARCHECITVSRVIKD